MIAFQIFLYTVKRVYDKNNFRLNKFVPRFYNMSLYGGDIFDAINLQWDVVRLILVFIARYNVATRIWVQDRPITKYC